VVHKYAERLLIEFHSSKQYAVYIEDGEIKGAILFSDVKYNDVFWISLIEAENETLYKELLNYAKIKALENNCRSIQLLVPELTELLNFVDSYGFKSWEQNQDFLLYEMPLHLIKQITGV
nr:hypothetical protein [Candidatus Cloacimonadota bacterium]